MRVWKGESIRLTHKNNTGEGSDEEMGVKEKEGIKLAHSSNASEREKNLKWTNNFIWQCLPVRGTVSDSESLAPSSVPLNLSCDWLAEAQAQASDSTVIIP